MTTEPTISDSNDAAYHEIRVKKGDTFTRVFRFWQDEGKTLELDITASTFKAQVMGGRRDQIVLTFTIGDGFAITAPNILTMTKTREQMQIPADTYWYDLQKSMGAVDKTLFKGPFVISDDKTT